MKTHAEILVLLAATAAPVARAQYDSFFFSTNATEFDCPGFPFECQYPFACSHDSTVDKYYCCIPGSTSNVCWTGSTDCSGNNGTAGSNQLDCGGYCCLEEREICTQREGQVNICWATAANPLADVTDARMNRTYSSLAAASPSATELSFRLAQVTSSLSATTATTSATTSSSTTSSASHSASGSSKSSSNSGISGGAIAGIVIGAIVGVLLIVGAAIFFWRRSSRQSKTVTPNHEPYRQPVLHEYYGSDVKQGQQPFHGPQEMDVGAQNRTELESTTSGGAPPVHELPGDRGI